DAPRALQGLGRRARGDRRQADRRRRRQHRRGPAVPERRHADPQPRADEPGAHQPRARAAHGEGAGLRHRDVVAARPGGAERPALRNPRAPGQGGGALGRRSRVPGEGDAVLRPDALPRAGAVRSAGARCRCAVPPAMEGDAMGRKMRAFIALAIWAPLAAAQGALQVPAKTLPVPDTVSPQVQKLIGAPLNPTYNQIPATPEEWKKQIAGVEAATMKGLPALREALKVKVEPTTIDGVKAYIVTPA